MYINTCALHTRMPQGSRSDSTRTGVTIQNVLRPISTRITVEVTNLGITYVDSFSNLKLRVATVCSF